eukprot:SAG31_NODE_24790_length_474_cov_0.802667_1_plen_151_part_10
MASQTNDQAIVAFQLGMLLNDDADNCAEIQARLTEALDVQKAQIEQYVELGRQQLQNERYASALKLFSLVLAVEEVDQTLVNSLMQSCVEAAPAGKWQKLCADEQYMQALHLYQLVRLSGASTADAETALSKDKLLSAARTMIRIAKAIEA